MKEPNIGIFPKPSTTSYRSMSPQKREETIVELSKDVYSEIFQDADVVPCKESDVGNFSELEKQLGIVNLENSDVMPPNQLDTTEDWDKEIQDSLAYNLVLEKFKERSHNQVYFQNQLQNLLYSYPPVSQAFTKTANYQSAIYSSSAVPPCGLPLSCPSDIDTGQFDDADEDSCTVST